MSKPLFPLLPMKAQFLSILIVLLILFGLNSCATQGSNSYAPRNMRRLLPEIDVKEEAFNNRMLDFAYCSLPKKSEYYRTADSSTVKYIPLNSISICIFTNNNTVVYDHLSAKGNIDKDGIQIIVNKYINEYDLHARSINESDTIGPDSSSNVVHYGGSIRFNYGGYILTFDEGMKYNGIPFDEGLYPKVVAFEYDSLRNKLIRLTNSNWLHSDATTLSGISKMNLDIMEEPLILDAYPIKRRLNSKAVRINRWPPFRRWKARLDSINAGLRPPEKSR